MDGANETSWRAGALLQPALGGLGCSGTCLDDDADFLTALQDRRDCI